MHATARVHLHDAYQDMELGQDSHQVPWLSSTIITLGEISPISSNQVHYPHLTKAPKSSKWKRNVPLGQITSVNEDEDLLAVFWLEEEEGTDTLDIHDVHVAPRVLSSPDLMDTNLTQVLDMLRKELDMQGSIMELESKVENLKAGVKEKNQHHKKVLQLAQKAREQIDRAMVNNQMDFMEHKGV